MCVASIASRTLPKSLRSEINWYNRVLVQYGLLGFLRMTVFTPSHNSWYAPVDTDKLRRASKVFDIPVGEFFLLKNLVILSEPGDLTNLCLPIMAITFLVVKVGVKPVLLGTSNTSESS